MQPVVKERAHSAAVAGAVTSEQAITVYASPIPIVPYGGNHLEDARECLACWSHIRLKAATMLQT